MRFGSRTFHLRMEEFLGSLTWPKQEDIVLAEALVPLVNEWTRTLLEQKAGQMVDPWPSLYYLYFEFFQVILYIPSIHAGKKSDVYVNNKYQGIIK